MSTLLRTAVALPVALLVGAPVAAQIDEVLLVERPEDRAGRARVAQKLAKLKLTVHAEEMAPAELARRLGTATSDEINFVVMSKDTPRDDLPKITLTLQDAGVLQLMGVVQDVTDYRFVYRSGIVILKPKAEVKELTVLRIYDVRAAVAPLRDHPGPKLGLGATGTEYVEADSGDTGKTLSGFTLDEIVDFIRNHVDPESWDRAGVSLSAMSGTLLVRQTVRNQQKVQSLLIQLGAIRAPVVHVRPPARRAPPKAEKR